MDWECYHPGLGLSVSFEHPRWKVVDILSISILGIICSLVFCRLVQCCSLTVVWDTFGIRQETFTKLTESTGKAGRSYENFCKLSSLSIYWTPRRGWFFKIASVCPYVCMWQLPSLNHAYNFADIWHEGRGPLVKKSDRARFAGKNQNWGFLGHLGSKMAQKCTLCHIARERNLQIFWFLAWR